MNTQDIYLKVQLTLHRGATYTAREIDLGNFLTLPLMPTYLITFVLQGKLNLRCTIKQIYKVWT